MDTLKKFNDCISTFTTKNSYSNDLAFEEAISFLETIKPLWDNLCFSIYNTDFEGIKIIEELYEEKIKIESQNKEEIIFTPKKCIYMQSYNIKDNIFMMQTTGKLKGLDNLIFPKYEKGEAHNTILIYPWNSNFTYVQNKIYFIEKFWGFSKKEEGLSGLFYKSTEEYQINQKKNSAVQRILLNKIINFDPLLKKKK